MVVCICRLIDDEAYDETTLKERIMQNDFKCGQCQLYYELFENIKKPANKSL